MPGHWAVSWAFRPSLLPGHLGTHPLFSGKAHCSISRRHLCPAPPRMPAAVQPLPGSLLLRRATRGRCRSSAGLGLAAAAVLQHGQLSCSQACKQLLEGSSSLCILLSTPPFLPGSALPGLASFPRLSSSKKSQEFAAPTLGGPVLLMGRVSSAWPLRGVNWPWAWGMVVGGRGSGDLWVPLGKLRSRAKVSERLQLAYIALPVGSG